MKSILTFLISLVMFASCSKETQKKNVAYLVSNSEQGFTASYMNEENTILTNFFYTPSADYKYTIYSYSANPGDIVYLSVTDTIELSYFKAFIFVDGKVYKQASRTNNRFMPVTISGTIPYNE